MSWSSDVPVVPTFGRCSWTARQRSAVPLFLYTGCWSLLSVFPGRRWTSMAATAACCYAYGDQCQPQTPLGPLNNTVYRHSLRDGVTENVMKSPREGLGEDGVIPGHLLFIYSRPRYQQALAVSLAGCHNENAPARGRQPKVTDKPAVVRQQCTCSTLTGSAFRHDASLQALHPTCPLPPPAATPS